MEGEKKAVNFLTQKKKSGFDFTESVKYPIGTVFTFILHCIYFNSSSLSQVSKFCKVKVSPPLRP